MHLAYFRKVNVQNGGILRVAKRGTFICAHAWIFFKLCILKNSLYTNYENVFIELDS